MPAYRYILLLLFAAGLFFGTTGLTVKRTTVEELTLSSQLVVHARVGTSFSRWEGANIYTHTSLEVVEAIKGDPPGSLTVKQLGGAVGEDALEVPGSPELAPGEEVVLFLVHWNGAYWIHSIVLGKFSVERTAGRAEAINDLNNVGLIDPTTGVEITDHAGKRNALPLELLKEQIHRHIQH